MNPGRSQLYSYVAPHLRSALILTLLSLTAFLLPTAVAAQDDDTDAAPPPLKIIPKEESSQLASQTDLKNYARVSLTLMEMHLVAAERLSTTQEAKEALRELGAFQALLGESLSHLEGKDTSNGKTLDALRKLEIGLRGFMPRLETVRRGLPLSCDEYVRKLMAGLRDARAKAIDPMFSDSVVRPGLDR